MGNKNSSSSSRDKSYARKSKACFSILPHQDAPLFKGDERENRLVIEQLITEVSTGSLTGREVREYLRQASLVSLWFFLKYIAGFAGPYNKLNDDLHLDMANWRQSEACMKEGARGAGFVPRSYFKDLACDTPVLSARGWTTHGELKAGDVVFSLEGKQVNVLSATETYYPETCLKVSFQDGATIVCGKGHLWKVDKKKRFRSRKHKTNRYEYYREIIRADELSIGDTVGVLEEPLQYREKRFLIDPYVLGAWLGDGHSSGSRITQAYKDYEVIQEIKNRGYTVKFYESGSTSTTGVYGIGIGRRGHREGFAHDLNIIGVKNNKHIPENYFEGSVNQRFDLLRGLMDTDGSTHKPTGAATFVNASERLAKDVYRLAATLRLRPRLRKHCGLIKGKKYNFYQVSFQHYADLQPFFLTRKAKNAKRYYKKRNLRYVTDIEEVQGVATNCIQVEGGLYCVGKEFVPTHNSTIWTHGADTWEIVRDSEIRIRMESNTVEKAVEFSNAIKNNFENNEFMSWLFPETIPPPGWVTSGNWSSDRFVIPSRKRFYPDATVKAAGSSGASEGGHVDLYNVDDPVGLDDLDSQRNSSIEMYRKKKRFINNKTTLLDEPVTDRVVMVGTRYAMDDIYDVAVNDAYEFIGYKVPEFKTKSDGEWSVYNRLGEEDGKFINPSKLNKEILTKAMEQDMWFAMTQLVNYPQKTGLAEFHEMPVKFADIRWVEEENDWVIAYEGDSNYEEMQDGVRLGDCDVVMSVDPAGTDKGISAKTSRSSIGIWARDSKDRVTRVWSKVGYLGTEELFDSMFEGNKLYQGYVRGTYVESNAMQKIILPLLRSQQWERQQYINPQPLPASGDKVARIRNAVGLSLSKGKLYVVRRYGKEFMEEHAIFPMNPYRMDVLDESEKGLSATRRPAGGEERKWQKAREQEVLAIDNVFGY